MAHWTERCHPSATAAESRKNPGASVAAIGRFMRRYVGLLAECVTSCHTFMVYSSALHHFVPGRLVEGVLHLDYREVARVVFHRHGEATQPDTYTHAPS